LIHLPRESTVGGAHSGPFRPQDPVAGRRFAGVLKSPLGDRVTIVVIFDAGHALFPEQPNAVAQAIAAFARRVYGM
jgi:pimeloyl-ACP methyl ester carboxylesterase